MYKIPALLVIIFTLQPVVFAQSIKSELCERVKKISIEAEVLYSDFDDSTSAIALMQNTQFRRALHSKPECFKNDQYLIYINQYSLYLSKTNKHRYINILEKFLSRFPENTLMYLYLGNMYKEIFQGQKRAQYRFKAISSYEKYIELSKNNKTIIDKGALEFLKNGGLVKVESTWGKYLNPNDVIPENRFKTFYINTNIPKKIIASEIVDSVSVNYSYKDFHGINSKDFGAYWVGNFTFTKNTTLQLNISQSWAKTRVIIDNLIVYEGGNNAEIPFNFVKGTHKIEVEYMNNWHTTSFSMGINPFQKLYKYNELKQNLKLSDDINVWYVGIYESQKKDHGVDLVLKKSQKPIVLLLQSHETTIWNITNPFKNTINAIIVGRSKPGSKVVGDLEEESIFYISSKLGNHRIYPKCNCLPPRFHCEGGNVINTNKRIATMLNKRINGFNGVYGGKEMVIPEIILDDKKYDEIEKKINDIEVERKECSKKTDPNFDQVFK